ncbi:MAG: nicotinate-nucleotide adenylyltransferase [Nitrospinota bacterium]|nr:nicotinate-nucleotide adenylyltransferase [Nitrospinota bacterium]
MIKSSPKRKAGILGGTFDPITLGHLGLARDIQEKLNLDRVWFVPAWQSPHKQDQSPTDAGHRLSMLKAALAPYPNFKISEIELDQKGLSYTIDTLTTLQNRHPDTEWYLILGMDTFRDFATWKNVPEILGRVHLAVATRPGYPNNLSPKALQALIDKLPVSYQPPQHVHGVQTCLCRETGTTLVFCDIEPLDISSSEVRERIKCGLSVKNMLPPEIERYIMTHRLYQANPRLQPE